MKKKKQSKTPLTPEEFCPIRHTLKVLGKRWTILIIKEIHYSRRGKLSFMELRKRLVNASSKVLSERLKDMAADNLVKRKVHADGIPVRVYYSLTPKGEDACNIIEDLKKYGLKWGEKDRFDCRNVDCELCRKNKATS